MGWLLVCHTGCGSYSKHHCTIMQQLCEDAVAHFRQGMVDLEAVEDAALQPDFKDRFYTLAVDTAALIENHPRTSAGRGSNPTIKECVELESCVMTESQELGCVTCVRECRNPCRLALAVLREARYERLLGRLPPRVLTGPGADHFAYTCGLGDPAAQSFLITEGRLSSCRKWKQTLQGMVDAKRAKSEDTHRSASPRDQPVGPRKEVAPDCEFSCASDADQAIPTDDDHEHGLASGRRAADDTIGVVAMHTSGIVIAVVSSGGHMLKEKGRVGLAGIPGAGVWVEPATVADNTVSQHATVTTGAGEDILSFLLARTCSESSVSQFRTLYPDTTFAAIKLSLTGTQQKGERVLSHAHVDVWMQGAGLVFAYATQDTPTQTYLRHASHQNYSIPVPL